MKKQDPTEMCAVIVEESRNFHISYYVSDMRTDEETARLEKAYGMRGIPVVACEQERLTLLPGLNYAEAGMIANARLDPNKCNVRCSFEDPCKMPSRRALDLVKQTVSNTALFQWRALETREEVQEAIDAKMEGAKR